MEATLDDYLRELQEEVRRFRKYWCKMMKKEPQLFKEKMQPGEWDLQFQAWQETQVLCTKVGK